MGHVPSAIATSAGSSLAVAIAAFLPPASEWDVTTVGAFAFLCGVVGRLAGMAVNFVKGKAENPTTGQLEWPIDDAMWGERFALAGATVGTLLALITP